MSCASAGAGLRRLALLMRASMPPKHATSSCRRTLDVLQSRATAAARRPSAGRSASPAPAAQGAAGVLRPGPSTGPRPTPRRRSRGAGRSTTTRGRQAEVDHSACTGRSSAPRTATGQAASGRRAPSRRPAPRCRAPLRSWPAVHAKRIDVAASRSTAAGPAAMGPEHSTRAQFAGRLDRACGIQSWRRAWLTDCLLLTSITFARRRRSFPFHVAVPHGRAAHAGGAPRA